MRKYSLEDAEKWVRDYFSGDSIKTVSENYGVPAAAVGNYCSAADVIRRIDRAGEPRTCPICKTKIESPKMRYCWNCGKNVESEEQKAVRDCDNLIKILGCYPHNLGTEGIAIAQKLKAFLTTRFSL